MGTMKKYRGMRALECLNTFNMSGAQIDSNYRAYNTIAFKFTDGTNATTLQYNRSYYNSLGLFMGGIRVIASADVLADFTGEEYADDGIGTTTIVSTATTKFQDKVSVTVVVSINNTTEASITVGSIKILKNCDNGNAKTLLCVGYYFDNPFTVPAGETVTKTLRFDFGE